MSREWSGSGISTKNRNHGTKSRVKRAAQQDDWYSKKQAARSVSRNKEFITSAHSRLIKYGRSSNFTKFAMKRYGF